jgi:hypothetical protein
MKNPANQIAQLRDRLIALENNSKVLPEGVMDAVKGVLGFGKAATQVANVLRQGASAVVNNKKFILHNGQWFEASVTGKTPNLSKLASQAEAEAANADALQNAKMLMHPNAGLLKADAEAFVNNRRYKIQKNGNWAEVDTNGAFKRNVTPEEAHAAEAKALSDRSQHKPPDTAGQQSGATVTNLASTPIPKDPSVLVDTLKTALGTMARSAEEVKAAREKVSLVIRILLATPALAYSYQDVMAKLDEKDYRGAIDAGLVGLVAAVFGKTPLAYSITTMAGLGLGTLAFYYVKGEPLTDEEKTKARELASTYYHDGKELDPSAKGDPPIPPRLWELTKKLHDQYQKQKPVTKTATTATTSGAAVPAKPASTAAPAVAAQPTPAPASSSGPTEPTPDELRKAAGIPKAEPPAPAAEPAPPSKPGRLKFS